MSPDDIKQITNLVALQLQQAAAEQATERQSFARIGARASTVKFWLGRGKNRRLPEPRPM